MYSLSVFCQYLYGSKGCVITKWWRLRAAEGGGEASADLKAEIFMIETAERPMLFVVIWVDG